MKLTDGAKNKYTTYYIIMAFLFLSGVAIYLFAHFYMGKLSQPAVHEIDEIVLLRAMSEIGIFISASVFVHLLYFLFIKKEEIKSIQDLKIQFRDETRIAMESVVHGINKWGLVRFHDKINYSNLFEQLQDGDELLWLDTYCPHIHGSSSSIKQALQRGAKIKMLVIDPGNEAVRWRAQEIADPYYAKEENFRNDVRRFIQFIESQKLPDRQSLQYRTYGDLPGQPLYIIIKNNGSLKVYSSFYIGVASADLVHIEWTSGAEDGGLAKYYCEYFRRKWERWEQSEIPTLEGIWRYSMNADDAETGWYGGGTCEILQVGQYLAIRGNRTSINNREIPPIPWRTQWAEFCPNDGMVRFDYTISSQISKKEYPAFGRLAVVDKNNRLETMKMEGRYYLLEKNNPDDPSAQTRSGTITFERLPEMRDGQGDISTIRYHCNASGVKQT